MINCSQFRFDFAFKFNLRRYITGFKHTVVWPDEESPNLYPITDLLPKSNEIAEVPGIYQVGAVQVDG